MTLGLDKFLTQINSGDVARPNLFKVEFNNYGSNNYNLNPTEPSTFESLKNQVTDIVLTNSAAARKVKGVYSPSLIRALGGDDILDLIRGDPESRDSILGFYIRSVQIPTSSITTEQSRNDRLVYNYPISAEYDSFSITFMMNPAHNQRQYFLNWMAKAYNEQTLSVGFLDDFVANITVKTFDRLGVLKTITEFEDCYPKSIGGLELNYDSSDLLQFTVEFAFRKYYSVEAKDSDAQNEFNRAKNLFINTRAIVNQFR